MTSRTSRSVSAVGASAAGVPVCATPRSSSTTRRSQCAWICGRTAVGDLGMRPLAARCHLGLGKLYRRTGKRQEAQEHLGTAITMYREMDMPFWLEPAEAEMRGLAR